MAHQESASLASLGRGNFSIVYCIKSSDDAFYAVKKYDRAVAVSSSGKIERILMEKQVMVTLKDMPHPCLINLIETQKDEAALYFVMSAALGGSLDRHVECAKDGRLDVSIALLYTSEIISGLLHLASAGIVHRDLKSRNCLLDDSGHIKICDFGSSKILSPSRGLTNRATAPMSATLTGSIRSIAPEMVAGCGHTFTVDWWALGILLYEMVSGQPPSFGLSQESDYKHVDEIKEPDIASAIEAIKLSRSSVPRGEAQSGQSWFVSFDKITDAIFSLSSSEEYAKNLIKRLLIPAPELRLGPWDEGEVKTHPLFRGVDWDGILAGTSAPPNSFFDRRIGNLDLLNRYGSSTEEDAISAEQQQLFDGF